MNVTKTPEKPMKVWCMASAGNYVHVVARSPTHATALLAQHRHLSVADVRSGLADRQLWSEATGKLAIFQEGARPETARERRLERAGDSSWKQRTRLATEWAALLPKGGFLCSEDY